MAHGTTVAQCWKQKPPLILGALLHLHSGRRSLWYCRRIAKSGGPHLTCVLISTDSGLNGDVSAAETCVPPPQRTVLLEPLAQAVSSGILFGELTQ